MFQAHQKNDPIMSCYLYSTFTTLNLPQSYLIHIVYWSLLLYSPLSSAQLQAVQGITPLFETDCILQPMAHVQTAQSGWDHKDKGVLHWLVNAAASLVVKRKLLLLQIFPVLTQWGCHWHTCAVCTFQQANDNDMHYGQKEKLKSIYKMICTICCRKRIASLSFYFH